MACKSLIPLILLLFFVSCGKVQTSAIKQDSSALVSKCNVVANSADPQNIEQLVVLLNSLPKPLDLGCFLKILKRPLQVNATSSTMSVQPAMGASSPRIFIIKGKLIISIVPSGEGSKVLEFSELTSSTRSIKGEIPLPVTGDLTLKHVFTNTVNGGRTSCSGCHHDERKETVKDGVDVFSSAALRPSSSKDVTVERLRQEQYICAANKDQSSRCSVISALFSHGEVRQFYFDLAMPTFLSNF